LAAEFAVGVIIIAHRRKAPADFADDEVSGSRAFTALARSVLHVRVDPKNPAQRLLVAGKQNLTAPGPGLAFTIAGNPPKLQWGGPVWLQADDLVGLERPSSRGRDPEALEEAKLWLQATLAAGPRLAKDLRDEWVHGQGGSERTLKRAKQFLCVEAFREEIPGPWWWRLPAKGANSTQDAKLGPLGPLEKLGPLGPLAKNKGKTAISDDGERKGAKFFILGPLDNPDRPADATTDAGGSADATMLAEQGRPSAAPGGAPDPEPDNREVRPAEAPDRTPPGGSNPDGLPGAESGAEDSEDVFVVPLLDEEAGSAADPAPQPAEPSVTGALGPAAPPPTLQRPGLEHAVTWLRGSLEGGPQPVAELVGWWTSRGYDRQLLYQAREKLGAVECQDAPELGLCWRLPG
jgi:hypothetical protein